MSSTGEEQPAAPILEVDDLAVSFPVAGGRVQAVAGISLRLQPGEVLGLVGESGCGKSTTARALVGLQGVDRGSIRISGEELVGARRGQWRHLRRRLQLVFQDPFASLNPRWSVGDIIAEPLRNYRVGSRHEQRQRVAELLALVGLEGDCVRRFPHEFSGGQRQRIGIARALALQPDILICDEPVSALDVSVQAQIINLLLDLRARLNLSLVIIAHDLAVVRHIADRVAVMYLGSIVEEGPSRALFAKPRHPYTQALLRAVPIPDPSRREHSLQPLSGESASHEQEIVGCPFAPRCPRVSERCQQQPPLSACGPTSVACWHAEDE